MCPPDTPNLANSKTALAPPSLATLGVPARTPGSTDEVRSWSGVSAAPDDDPLIGTTLRETYVIDRVLGEGGMGRVFLAHHHRITSKRYAIKTLHPELLRNREATTRFFREAETAAGITSDHVVDVYDVDRAPDGRPFLVCEYLDGLDLAQHLTKVRKLSVPVAVGIIRQVCRGLMAAHARGVVHRDIKPDNIFLSGDLRAPSVKVLDFGISRLETAESTSLTQTGSILGTPAYMAPEQARGEAVDQRTDVYAVGGVLYATVVGRPPFSRDNPTAMLAAVLTEEPIRPREIDPNIPPGLEAVIQQAMAKDPDRRFADVGALADALTPFDAPSTAMATTSRSTGNTDDAQLARPTLVILSAVTLLFLGVGFVGAAESLLRPQGLGPMLRSILIGGVLFAALVTPVWLFIKHVRAEVWNNVHRVSDFSASLRRPLGAALLAVGLTTLSARFTESVVLSRESGMAWPYWDLLMFSSGLGAALLAALSGRKKRPNERPTMGFWATIIGSASLVGGVFTVSLLRSEPSVERAVAGTSLPRGASTATQAAAGEDDDEQQPEIDNRVVVANLRRSALDAAGEGQFEQAMGHTEELLAVSPEAAEEREVQNAVRLAALQPAPAGPKAFELMSTKMGSNGPDLLYELAENQPRVAKRANQLLAAPSVRELASAALLVTLDLRDTPGCEKLNHLERAQTIGDTRAVKHIRRLALGSSRGCGVLSLGSCPPPCGHKRAQEILATIKAIESRAASPPG